MRPATQDDWLTEPFPDEYVTLNVDRHFTESEMANIRLGFIPRIMEQKWFAYCKHNTLYLHRSWSGHCIYVADFAKEGGGYVIKRLRAALSQERYDESREAEEVEWFLDLVDHFLIDRSSHE